jgi:cyclase
MITRRRFLTGSAMAAAGTLAPRPSAFALLQSQEPATPATPQTTPAVPQTLIQKLRAAGATTPIQTTKLRDTIFLLQGVGGNMVAQIGPDGKLLIDASVATAARAVTQTLEKLGTRPLKLLINTHWHFDHTDGNAALHDAGAFIIAQENTRRRLSVTQKVAMLHAEFPASPTAGLPQLTFIDSEKLYFDNDELHMIHTPKAHTDSDIFLQFVNGNVIHTGDLWFNGVYPFIDDSTGGTINGMIQGVDKVLTRADDKTKIVPGHGLPGDKRALQKYREMLYMVADRIADMKGTGKSLDQVIAAKPTADLDSVWAHGSMTPDMFVTVIYRTL